ncbi:TRAP transporter small permease [Oscillospiraceae bacterium PP1C4]
MAKSLNKLFKMIEVLMATMLALMVALVFMNVILRYFFNSGITWSEEMARYLFVWTIYIGAIGAMRDNEHLGVDTVIRRLPAKGQKVCYLIGQVMILVIMLILLKGSWDLTLLNVDSKAAATGLPLVMVYGAGILTSACITLNVVANIHKALFVPGALESLITMHESEEDVIVEDLEEQNRKEEEK